MNKKISIVLVLILMMSSVFTGCSIDKKDISENATSTATDIKILSFLAPSEPPNIDPQLGTDANSISITNGILEGLIRVHEGKVKPGMAESWDITPDGLTYTFHLRDAKWNDGKPVTAKDFEYSFIRLIDPKTAAEYAYQAYYIENAEEYNTGKITDVNKVKVKAIDDKTLEIKLKTPTKYFLGLLSFISFLPCRQDAVEAHGEAYASSSETMVYNGPFVLKEWKHEESLMLEKNLNYWDKDNIKLDGVAISIVTDPTTQVNMFEAGETDFVFVGGNFLNIYKDRLKYFYDGSEFWFEFNMIGRADSKPEIAKLLNNTNFIKAVGFAIDRELILDAVAKDGSSPALRFVHAGLMGNDKLYSEEYPLDYYSKNADVVKAKEYMDKAMKELKTTVDKIPSIELLTHDGTNIRETAEAIQDSLSKVLGIKLEVKQVPMKQRLQLAREKNFEMMLGGWGPDYDDPMTYLDYMNSKSGFNNTGWYDKKYDELIERCKVEPNWVTRCEMMFEAEKYLLDNGPIVPFYHRRRAWVSQDYVKNLSRNMIGADPDYVYADIVK